MNNRTGFLLIIVPLALFIKSSCKTSEFGFKVMDLNGMVYDFSNRPVAHCDISLAWWFKSSTDINGRFTIPKLPYGIYTLTAHKKGFEVYTEEIIIKNSEQIVYFRIPSQNQLLDLVDEALTANDLAAAEELVERAYKIDSNSIETLYYYATIKFKQNDYQEAITFLEAAKDLGSKDTYIDKFLTILWELHDAR